jgi:hypothetical protein
VLLLSDKFRLILKVLNVTFSYKSVLTPIIDMLMVLSLHYFSLKDLFFII